jgi:hypothetical protein
MKTGSPVLAGLALGAAIAAAPPVTGLLAAALDEVTVRPAVAWRYGNCPDCVANVPSAGVLSTVLDKVAVNPAAAIAYGNCPHCLTRHEVEADPAPGHTPS